MAKLLYANTRPKRISYNGAQVKKVYYNNALVWRMGEYYKITGALIGSGATINADCEETNCHSGHENCLSESLTDYTYRLKLIFSGVTKWPIKYISKSGATVSIQKTSVTQSGDKWVYESTEMNDREPRYGDSDETYDYKSGYNTLKSIFPDKGVSGYCSIESINIAQVDNGVTLSNCNCQYNCQTNDCTQSDCDCAGDMDCDGGGDGGDGC